MAAREAEAALNDQGEGDDLFQTVKRKPTVEEGGAAEKGSRLGST